MFILGIFSETFEALKRESEIEVENQRITCLRNDVQKRAWKSAVRSIMYLRHYLDEETLALACAVIHEERVKDKLSVKNVRIEYHQNYIYFSNF